MLKIGFFTFNYVYLSKLRFEILLKTLMLILCLFSNNLLISFSQHKDVLAIKKQLAYTHGKVKIELFNTLAEIYLISSNEQAIITANEAFDSIKRYQIHVDELITANLNSTLGAAYYNLGDFKNAAKHLEKEFIIIGDTKLNEELFYSSFNLGTIYKKMNSNRKSVKFYLKSLDLAEKENKGDLVLQNYQALYEVYEALSDNTNSLRYLKLYNQLKDSLVITEAKHEITILKTKYKTAIIEKKKKEKELVTKDKELKEKNIELLSAELKEEKLIEDSILKAEQIKQLNLERELKELRLKHEANRIREQQRIIGYLAILFVLILGFLAIIYIQYREKKIANKKLIELNAMKDKFFSIIAHDLKNPFNQILGFSELLITELPKLNKEQIDDYIKEIYNASSLTYKLLENLLEWSRTQSGSITLKPSKIKVKDAVHNQIIFIRNLASIKEITLHNEVDENLIIYADSNMLQTILRNLISNAVKYSEISGTIVINARNIEYFVEISVCDTGIGIDSDSLQKIFRIDTNLSTAGTAQEAGTGLGLILCKEFVERHGGTITAESEKGKGSTFIFRLPNPKYED